MIEKKTITTCENNDEKESKSNGTYDIAFFIVSIKIIYY
jgi:hypothetical protein